MPLVPFPVTRKLPPAANVPPPFRLPLINAPVENLTEPKLPVTNPMPFKPFTAMRVEPLSDNPAVLPESRPAPLVKSTELPANADRGRAKASRTIKTIRFINFLLNPITCWTAIRILEGSCPLTRAAFTTPVHFKHLKYQTGNLCKPLILNRLQDESARIEQGNCKFVHTNASVLRFYQYL